MYSQMYSQKENSLELDFFVVNAITNNKSPCILGLSSSVLLNLIKKVDKAKCVNILNDFPDLLQGVGLYKRWAWYLLKPDANPVIHSPRRVPIAVKPRLLKKLQELELRLFLVWAASKCFQEVKRNVGKITSFTIFQSYETCGPIGGQ